MSRRGRGRSFRGRGGWDHERGIIGSESLNWRSAEPEIPPAEFNTDPVRSQTHGVPQVPTTSIGSSKIENVSEHQDYVAFLRSAWNEISGGKIDGVTHMELCEPSADLLPPLDLKAWTKEREIPSAKR